MKSRTSNVRIGTLPCVLQDVVFQFAYNMPRDDVLKSLDVILTIIDMKLPFFFFREKKYFFFPDSNTRGQKSFY